MVKPARAPLVKLGACFKEEHEIACPFDAELAGVAVRITCVLERTAVYHAHNDSERYLAKHDRFRVELARLKFKKINNTLQQQYAKGRKRGKAIQLGHHFKEPIAK